ncbi:MAG: tripartite tricarboxylate transporter TctB family protein [Pseudomonadota bacterium]
MAQKTSDLVSGLVVIGFALTLYFFLIPNFVASSEHGAMSPQFFPFLGAILIGLGGLALIIASAFRNDADAGSNKSDFGVSKFVLALLVAAAMAGFILLFQLAGYFYAAPPFLAVLMVLFGARGPLIIVVTAAVTTAALYAVFSLGLNLPLV